MESPPLFNRLILFLSTRDRLLVLEPKLSAAIADLDFIAARATVDGDSMVRNVLRAGLDQVARGKKNPGAAEQAMLGVLARERARYDA